MFSRTITFTGQGPANAVIQIRQGETIIGTTTTDDAGSFTLELGLWYYGRTFVFNFTAKVPDREKKVLPPLYYCGGWNWAYLVSALAKADPPFESAPTITG